VVRRVVDGAADRELAGEVEIPLQLAQRLGERVVDGRHCPHDRIL
jgi:hypothetical protein